MWKLGDAEVATIRTLSSMGQSDKEIVAYMAERKVRTSVSTVRYWTLEVSHLPSERRGRAPTTQEKRLRAKRRVLCEKLVQQTAQRVAERFTPRRRKRNVRVETVRPFGSPARIARKINAEALLGKGVSVSKSTVRRDLLACSLKPYVCRKGPRLTDQARADRRLFALKMTSPRMAPVSVEKLVFTDEKWFDTEDGRTWFWRR